MAYTLRRVWIEGGTSFWDNFATTQGGTEEKMHFPPLKLGFLNPTFPKISPKIVEGET